jgi:two-component system sensor histidine kinase/response regulator
VMTEAPFAGNQDEETYSILLVDDDELVVESFDRVFQQNGSRYNVDRTTDSREALSLLEHKTYDLVITDLVMPEVDGIQVLQKVKSVSPETEVILITAYSSTNSALDALHFGAFDYIPKPFNPSELKLRILRAINKRKAILERNRKTAELERLTYTIAHDFKASVISIKGFTQILAQDYFDKLNSEGMFLLYRINSNISSMETMIEGLLEYSKIGRVEVQWKNINVHELVQETAQNFAPALKENAIRLSIEGTLPTVSFYRSGLQQIFTNLIDNSIKYARPDADSYIKIGVSNHGLPVDERHYQFYVEDNGIGITKENLKLIFEIFQREEITGPAKGYGIGLAVVKKILESAGCSIRAESEKGVKTVFTFTVPKGR